MNLGLWMFADDLVVGFLHMQGPPNRLYASNPDPTLIQGPSYRLAMLGWRVLTPSQTFSLSQAPIICLPQGPVAPTASVFSVLSSGPGLPPPPPPPPPPGPPPLFENEGKSEESSPSRSALFAQLNQGEAITKGKKASPRSWLPFPLALGPP